MASQFRDILTGLYTALRANHSSYDLRTAGDGTVRVQWADHSQFPMVSPLVLLGNLQIRTGYANADMGAYDVNGSLEWVGYVSAPDLTPESRALAASDLANDVVTAIQNGHHNDANTGLFDLQQLLVSVDDIYGDGADFLTGYAVAFGKITWQRVSVRGI